MKNKLIMILADGFEEIEALTPIDFLRRLGMDITIAGLENKVIEGAHNIKIEADIMLESSDLIFDGIILPGGMPGSTNLRDSSLVIEILQEANKGNKLIAAICAAPIALNAAGILKNRKITSHPSVEKAFSGDVYSGARTEKDRNIITAKGPGTAIEFAIMISKYFGMEEKAIELEKEMFFL